MRREPHRPEAPAPGSPEQSQEAREQRSRPWAEADPESGSMLTGCVVLDEALDLSHPIFSLEEGLIVAQCLGGVD